MQTKIRRRKSNNDCTDITEMFYSYLQIGKKNRRRKNKKKWKTEEIKTYGMKRMKEIDNESFMLHGAHHGSFDSKF